MMNLDEAIKHCEEKAKELRTSRAYTDIEGNLRATETCEECAREHEQLAEWLKELKSYKEAPQGDTISRSALKEEINEYHLFYFNLNQIETIINNAPTVDLTKNQAYDKGFITAMKLYSRPKGDLISRQDAIDALEEQLDYLQMLNKNENPTAEGKWYGVNWARNTIADLPYKQNERPQGECVDISKLRLMTVEECAGHTIDYAMGWKACIEWIKKGGAE